jgi:hypothetical protein
MTFEDLYGPQIDFQINTSDSNVLFTTARRKDAINAAQEEFADLTECLVRQSSITCSCNTTEYLLLSSGILSGSTDYTRLAVQGVEYLHTDSNGRLTQLAGDDFPERPIQWANRQAPGWRTSTSVTTTPSGYYLRADGGNLYFGLYDRPSVGSSEMAVVRVPYVARPAAMTSPGDLPFTVAGSARTDLTLYHRALPHYAAYKLLPLRGDEEGAARQLQFFMGYVTRYLNQQRPRGGRMVQYAQSYRGNAQGLRPQSRIAPGWTWQRGG